MSYGGFIENNGHIRPGKQKIGIEDQHREDKNYANWKTRVRGKDQT